MSKQSEAKARQNYQPKPIPRTCNTCDHFTFDTVQPWPPNPYTRDANLRCGLGGFAVKKTATCDSYAQRVIARNE